MKRLSKAGRLNKTNQTNKKTKVKRNAAIAEHIELFYNPNDII